MDGVADLPPVLEARGRLSSPCSNQALAVGCPGKTPTGRQLPLGAGMPLESGDPRALSSQPDGGGGGWGCALVKGDLGRVLVASATPAAFGALFALVVPSSQRVATTCLTF